MDIERALDHLDEIHHHLTRQQVYRGVRSATLVLSSATALTAALLQPSILGAVPSPQHFIDFWVGVATINLLLGGTTVAWNYVFRATEPDRRITRRVVGQFVPSLGAGAIVTAALAFSPEARLAPMLPALWSLLYGLGVFAARPFLPKSIGWVALFYVLAGGVLLKGAGEGWSLSPWAMGSTFAFGQLGAAVILFWNLERKKHA